jgi:hypothetical protein
MEKTKVRLDHVFPPLNATEYIQPLAAWAPCIELLTFCGLNKSRRIFEMANIP